MYLGVSTVKVDMWNCKNRSSWNVYMQQMLLIQEEPIQLLLLLPTSWSILLNLSSKRDDWTKLCCISSSFMTRKKQVCLRFKQPWKPRHPSNQNTPSLSKTFMGVQSIGFHCNAHTKWLLRYWASSYWGLGWPMNCDLWTTASILSPKMPCEPGLGK